MTNFTVDQLTGKTDTHIEYRSQTSHTGSSVRIGLLPEVWVALEQLQVQAHADGIALTLASGFRSFERQSQIWNAKASGEREVVDDNGEPINVRELSPRECCEAIMRWSALPGCSRHHWGTDLDVYDVAPLERDYDLQLLPEEYAENGVFSRLSAWLQQAIDNDTSCGFFRPYAVDRGGIAPEPWHLSFKPRAQECQQQLKLAMLEELLQGEELELSEVVLSNLPELYSKYVYVAD